MPAIIGRIKAKTGLSSDKEVAKALGRSPQWLSNLVQVAESGYKPGGAAKLPYRELVNWAIDNEVSVDWLLTGKGDNRSLAAPQPIAPPSQAIITLPTWNQCPLLEDERILLEETLDVLRSPGLPGEWDESLKRNIRSFRSGVAIEAGRPRCHEPPLQHSGRQNRASGGGQQ